MANRKYKYEDMQPVLERLLQDKESDELEFKTAAGGFPKSFWSSYSSFANTNGGAIAFGVKEKDEELIGWEKQNWKRPYIVERSRPNKVILTMSMESLLDENVKNGLIRLFGERVEQLPQPQLMALAMAYSEEEITNERLQYALDIHRADITKMLSDMCATHLLEASGHGRGTKYHVYGVKLASYTGNLASSGENLATSKENLATSKENLASPDENLATSEMNLASSKKKRFSKLEIEKLILDFCTEWRTVEDIATFLDRDKNYIRNEILPHLADKLVKMYENVPNHPRQKYRARTNY